jgi:O-acetylhomoserine (thiol)-lyase
MTMSDQWGFETRQIHSGQEPDPTTGSRTVPIYQTTSYVFRDSEHAANLFALAEVGNIYTRIMNPTQMVLEARMQALEGGTDTAIGIPGALAVASGQAAETLAILNLAESGDHIVASASLYGGTYNLLHYTLAKMGIEVTFIDDPDNLDLWAAAIRPDTKAFYGETIGNPKNDCLDLKAISALGHDNDIPMIVDNTVASPYLMNPLALGADIVVHSMTKFIGGHGNSIGGVIIDGGTFDYGASGRFSNFIDPDPSYHGLAYWPALGHGSYIIKARVQLLRDIGAAVTPHNSFYFLQGLETLSLRMERHCANAMAVAEFLDGHDQVEAVQYAGLESSPWHDRMAEYTNGRGFGSVPAFTIKGGREEVRQLAGAAQPRGQHRRRAESRNPSGIDHPLTAECQRAAFHRRRSGPGEALRRARDPR